MIRATGGTASAYPCDVSDDAQVAGAVGAAHDDLGRISGVVTAAGIFHGPDLRPTHEVSVEDFMTVLRVNLVGTFAAIKHTLPDLTEGGGTIVTIASTTAIHGHGFGAGYTASKGGVKRAHSFARGAVRPARRARELHLPGRCRHTDDRRHVRDAGSDRAREAHGSTRPSRPARRHRRRRGVLADRRRPPSHRHDAARRGRRDDLVTRVWLKLLEKYPHML